MKASKQLIYLVILFILLASCADGTTGEKTYQKKCSNCHGKEGEGLKKLIPPLSGSDFLIDKKSELPCIVRNGMNDTIIVNGQKFIGSMPGNNELSDIEITNLVNYINRQWGDHSYRSVQEIRIELDRCD
ncbi:c-type cytochrome [Sporocytophaga myxococcoides]|uniref:c-type cytochrome n=1 Tax=Sporocytophaga myxococcoides TaxID=153721 RepID=UPI000405F3BC|nr:cytochrome c [Sporocytophaga myxococcoides]